MELSLLSSGSCLLESLKDLYFLVTVVILGTAGPSDNTAGATQPWESNIKVGVPDRVEVFHQYLSHLNLYNKES
jgi:hypothetical protein